MTATPNVQNINTVLDFLEAHPDKHDQEHWVENDGFMPQDGALYGYPDATIETLSVDCGTTGCIAGWTVLLLLHDRRLKATMVDGFYHVGQGLLGLDCEQAQFVFLDTANVSASSGNQMAIDALRTIRDNPSITRSELKERFIGAA